MIVDESHDKASNECEWCERTNEHYEIRYIRIGDEDVWNVWVLYLDELYCIKDRIEGCYIDRIGIDCRFQSNSWIRNLQNRSKVSKIGILGIFRESLWVPNIVKWRVIDYYPRILGENGWNWTILVKVMYSSLQSNESVLFIQ